MMENSSCLICNKKFPRIYSIKQHLLSRKHHVRKEEIFQKEILKPPGFFPYIIVFRVIRDKPFVGLSMLTFCISVDGNVSFYLCHCCGEKCPSNRIVTHVFSDSHYSNYLNYTDPDSLNFAWIPSMTEHRITLATSVRRKVFANGYGELQMLDLPGDLITVLETKMYSEVMQRVSENKELLMLMNVSMSKCVTLRTYLQDSQRKHPLLGLQHIIECVCTGEPWKAYYLCTLCKLSVPSRAIIRHILSFDHIHSYFNVWHPSTLLPKQCYQEYSKTFSSRMLNYAKQTLEIHSTLNADMKQVIMEPDVFASVNFASYLEALTRVDSIRCEDKMSSLITVVKPGKRLEYQETSAAPETSAASVGSATPAAPLKPAVCPAPGDPAASEALKVPAAADAEPALPHNIRCQNCSMIFNTLQQYCKHLATFQHHKMLEKCFQKVHNAENGPKQKDWTDRIGLFPSLKAGLRTQWPLVGVPLIVICISTEAEVQPLYLCFACKDCFSENLLTQHFNSTKHLIHVLLYQNPWRLPFAWENELDVTHLRLMATKEEKLRKPELMLVKILDVPYWMFLKFRCNYENEMRVLQLSHSLLMHSVPSCKTYRKLNNSDRFPLLGQEFLVMHNVSGPYSEDLDVAFLCLLCKRTLSNEESYAHVFSREHVTSFLEAFHPGSLNSNTASQIFDLAKQAARLHSISHIQVIQGGRPIDRPYTYQQATLVSASIKYKSGKGKLHPRILPKGKLVPRIITQQVDRKQGPKGSQPGTETQTSKRPLPSSYPTVGMVTDLGLGATSTCGNTTKRPPGGIPTSTENMSEEGKATISQSHSVQIKKECSDVLQVMKEEKTEESIEQEPTEITTEGSFTISSGVKIEAEEQIGASSVKSEEETSKENIEEMDQTEQHFSIKQEQSCEEPFNLSSIRNAKANTDSSGPSQKTLKDTGITEPDALAWQNLDPALTPTSSLSRVQCKDDQQVADMVTEDGTEAQRASVNKSPTVKNESTSRAADFVNKSSQEYKISQKLPTSAGNTLMPVVGRKELHLKPLESADAVRVRRNSTGNGSNANQMQEPTAKPFNASAHCDVTTSVESAVAGPSCRDTGSSSSKETAKSPACKSGHQASSSNRSSPIVESTESLRKSAATITKRRATSSDCSLPSKMSKNSDVRSHAVHVPPTTVPPVEHGVTEASSNTLKKPQCTHEAPHSTSQTSTGADEKSPACDSVSKPTKKPPAVGRNQLIVVSCESKRQVYCKLCSVKLTGKCHLQENRHKYNYVKKFFGITHKLSPDVLDKVVTSLSEAEKDLESQTFQTIKVNMDTYKELQDLPVNKALERLKEMLAQDDSGVFSSVSNTADDSILKSPTGVFSPRDEMEPTLKQDRSKAEDQMERATVTKRSDPDPSADQLPSWPTSSRNDRIDPTGAEDVVKAAHKMDAYQDGQCRPPAACVDRRLRQRSEPELQLNEILPGITDKPSLSKVSSPNLLPAAPGIVEEQDPQRTSHTSKPVPKSSVPNTGAPLAKSHSLSRISIGLSSIWECRGIASNQLPSFYLCESCEEKLSIDLICKHMNSTTHHLAYLMKHYPRDMLFWGQKDLTYMAKLSGLKDVVNLLSKHETYAKMDAQVVLLREDLYKCIQAAPVREALKLVQSVTKGPNSKLLRALLAYEESKIAEKHLMDEGKRGRVLNPVDMTCVSGKMDSFGGADTPATPQGNAKMSLDPQSEPQVHQKSLPESPSSTVSSPKSVNSAVTQKDECLHTRKRPPDESPESLPSPHKVNSQLDPSVCLTTLPTGCAATSPLFFSKGKDDQLGSPKADMFDVHQFTGLISLIKTLKNAETATGESASSQNCVESSCVQQPSQPKGRRWDLEVRKAAVNPKLPSASSVASKQDQPVGYEARITEESSPLCSVRTNDTSEKQPEEDVNVQDTVKNETQLASCPVVAGTQNSGQTSQPQNLAEIDSTVCLTPINCTKVNSEHQLTHCVSAPASGHCSHDNQMTNSRNEQVSSSAEAVNANTSNQPLVHSANSHKPGSNTPIFNAGQEANCCVHLGIQTTPGGLGLEVQHQQIQQQQILQLLQQQQILQQQLHQCQIQQVQQQQMQQYQMYQQQLYQYQTYQQQQQQQQQSNQEQVQERTQQQMQQYQMYQQQMHQYQTYQQQQSNQEQVQERTQQQMPQYQMYQQQMYQYQTYQQQQSNQEQVQQRPYSQHGGGSTMAPY
ncbi:uncharacterized protein LOC130518737 isoform X2 [Takifugu flavidus]|uniref:uncharacterized protein LOC130518737 isoform X2 n=1 Tax=Takifugu flavidus TaxID=433684 RepID=UPI002544C4B1|nr:uncharacterized protein LOC130518737 isoform X2 [Takifugu flavidus]